MADVAKIEEINGETTQESIFVVEKDSSVTEKDFSEIESAGKELEQRNDQSECPEAVTQTPAPKEILPTRTSETVDPRGSLNDKSCMNEYLIQL
jgi:hypothetical protein